MNIVQPIRDKKKLQKFLQLSKERNYLIYVIFQVGINSGLRVSDILNLNIKDVCNKREIEKADLITLEIKDFIEIREQKTSKPKKFPIKDELKKVLREYLEWYSNENRWAKERGILFASSWHNRIHRSAVYKNINKIAKEAGIDERVGTHTMRKTFGYHFYKQTKDLTLLQSILNHSSGATTLRYIGITQDNIDKSYRALSYKTETRVLDQSDNIIKAIYKIADKLQEMDNRLRSLGV